MNKPSNISFQITRKCNLTCSHCYSIYDKKQKIVDLPINVIENLLRNLSEMEVEAITLLGGEPFIRKDIFEIIELCNKYSIRPEIVTNGTVANYEKLLKCKELGVKRIAFSIDGLEKEHNTIRGNRTFEKTIKSIEISNELGLSVRIITVVNKTNQHSIVELIKKIQGLADIHKLIYFTPFGYGEMKDWINPIEWLSFIENIKKNYVDNNTTNVFVQQPYILKPQENLCELKSMYISSDGNVYPCILFLDTKYTVGNISDKSFKEIWELDWQINRTHNHCIGYSNIFNNDINIPIEQTHNFGKYKLGCMLQCNKEKPEQLGNLYIY